MTVLMTFSKPKQLVVIAVVAIVAMAGSLLVSCQPRRPAASVVPPATSRPRAGWPQTFTDDLGNTVVLAQPPRRIITLQPNLAEIVALVGAIDQLVGVTEFCNYPPEAAAKPKVGGIINPSLEKIVGLQPDLVLASRGNDAAFIRRLQQMGIEVLGYDPQRLEEVIDLVRRLGEITGHHQQAEKAAQELEKRQQAVIQQAQNLSTPGLKVLFVLSWEPLFVAGATSFVDDMITTAGGQNVVAHITGVDQKKPWPQISREAVVAANPEVIISTTVHGLPQRAGQEEILRRLKTDPAWQQVTAIKHGQVHIIEDDLVTIPGPRLIAGLEQVSEVLTQANRRYHHLGFNNE